MSILYPQEHTSCFNYEKGKNASLEILRVEKGGRIERDLYSTEIVFVIKGRFILNYSKVIDREITKGKFMLFPPGSHVHAEVTEETDIIVCRIRGMVQLCECMPLKQLYPLDSPCFEKYSGFHVLDINEKLDKFISFMIECAEDGLRCSYYFETKMKELFFLLRAYYTTEELRALFASVMCHDARFMYLMYEHHRNVKSVSELAEIARYSESGFKKQFQRVFGTSPSDWLRNQKASHIFHDLNCSEESIKELSDKYDFASVSSFTTFCQNMFGKTPGQIRNIREQPLPQQEECKT